MKRTSTGSKEAWKRVKGFGGRYEVSTHGRVRSSDMEVNARGGATAIRKGRMLGFMVSPAGYYKLTLAFGEERKQMFVHHLVLNTFVGPKPYDGAHSRHLDGNRKNNKLENLKWGTAMENSHDRANNDMWLKGERIGTSTLKEHQVKELIESSKPHQYFADKFGVTRSCVCSIRNGRSWKHMDPLRTVNGKPRFYLRG